MYAATQDRLHASNETRFSEAYFDALLRLDANNLFVAAVTKDGEIASAVIVLCGARFAHCHLMGYTGVGAGAGVSNLLYHGVALHSASQGLILLHMGGGATRAEDDSLLRFKRSFAHQRFSYQIGKRSHDPAAYESLREAWRRHHPDNHYFLFYRFPR
jgi:hypothetical protein